MSVLKKSKMTSKSFYKNKNILVTGGSGFIGSTLVRSLVSYGANVTVVDSLRSEQGGNLFNLKGVLDKVNLNISDIRDPDSMNMLVKGKDLMFNLAGTLSHVDSMTDPFTDLSINSHGQIVLLEACRKNNPNIKIVYAGTRNQYGKIQYLPVDEKHPSMPTDVNSINKVAGEQYHMLYFNDYGIKSTSLRIANTFGPRHQMKHPKQGVLNWFLRQIMDGKKITLYGTGEQIRDTNYVDDVVDAMLLAGMSKKVWGQAFNLGGSPVSLKDFVKIAIKIYKNGEFTIEPTPEDRKKIEIGDYIADYSKITGILGWKPKVGIDEGIRKTFDFYKKYRKYYW